MARDQLARILYALSALQKRFEKIAELGNHGERQRCGCDPDIAPACQLGKKRPAGQPTDRTAESTAPGLARRDRRRELRAADRPADEIGKYVGGPHDREQEKNEEKSCPPVTTDKRQREGGDCRVSHACRIPEPLPARPSVD